MTDSKDLLDGLKPEQKQRLLGALASLSWSDGRVVESEMQLFLDLASWMGVEEHEARLILDEPDDPERLRLDGLPKKVRAVVFVTGAMMVLVDQKFTPQERQDLAVLASFLDIAPASARETVHELKKRSKLREQIREAMSQAHPIAEKDSPEASKYRNLVGVLSIFFGVGVGAFTAPTIIPGVIAGMFVGALGGGILGKVVAGAEKFRPQDYDFEDL